MVSQEPRLFDASVAENIRYGRQQVALRRPWRRRWSLAGQASMEEIVESAKAANIHEFIMASSERLAEHWPRLLVIDAALLLHCCRWLAGWLVCVGDV